MWTFIQNEILGMQWLNRLIGAGLGAAGMDLGSRLGGSVQFFLYDVIKISVLLVVLIFCVSYIQSYFPPERSRQDPGPIPWVGCQSDRGPSGNGDTVLLLLLHSPFHGIYQRRLVPGGYLFFPDFFSHGRSGEPGTADGSIRL